MIFIKVPLGDAYSEHELHRLRVCRIIYLLLLSRLSPQRVETLVILNYAVIHGVMSRLDGLTPPGETSFISTNSARRQS